MAGATLPGGAYSDDAERCGTLGPRARPVLLPVACGTGRDHCRKSEPVGPGPRVQQCGLFAAELAERWR